MPEEVDDNEAFSEWLASCRGVRDLKDYSYTDREDLLEWAGDVWQLLEHLGNDAKQYQQALKLLQLLQPTNVDAQLWEDLALKGESSLLTQHQFGARSSRQKGQQTAQKSDPRTQFLRRQGKAAVRAEAEVLRLQQELENAKIHRADIQNGLQAFASAGLISQMRKATAPMFAMGPAWTLLRAIQGPTGEEISLDARKAETQIILIVLHALRGEANFEHELKRTLLQVCRKWVTEAKKRGKAGTEFDGPHEYEYIIDNLGWPEPDLETDLELRVTEDWEDFDFS